MGRLRGAPFSLLASRRPCPSCGLAPCPAIFLRLRGVPAHQPGGRRSPQELTLSSALQGLSDVPPSEDKPQRVFRHGTATPATGTKLVRWSGNNTQSFCTFSIQERRTRGFVDGPCPFLYYNCSYNSSKLKASVRGALGTAVLTRDSAPSECRTGLAPTATCDLRPRPLGSASALSRKPSWALASLSGRRGTRHVSLLCARRAPTSGRRQGLRSPVS